MEQLNGLLSFYRTVNRGLHKELHWHLFQFNMPLLFQESEFLFSAECSAGSWSSRHYGKCQRSIYFRLELFKPPKTKCC